MNKDVSASSPLCVQRALVTVAIIYSPAMTQSGGVGLLGNWEVEPQLPIVWKIYHLTRTENFTQEMNS